MSRYILDGRKPIIEPDLMRWTEALENTDRQVKRTKTREYLDDGKLIFVDVSTVFLGIDHSYGGGRPILFETMVFGGKLDQEMDRCSTWEEAEKMHDLMVEKVKAND